MIDLFNSISFKIKQNDSSPATIHSIQWFFDSFNDQPWTPSLSVFISRICELVRDSDLYIHLKAANLRFFNPYNAYGQTAADRCLATFGDNMLFPVELPQNLHTFTVYSLTNGGGFKLYSTLPAERKISDDAVNPLKRDFDIDKLQQMRKASKSESVRKRYTHQMSVALDYEAKFLRERLGFDVILPEAISSKGSWQVVAPHSLKPLQETSWLKAKLLAYLNFEKSTSLNILGDIETLDFTTEGESLFLEGEHSLPEFVDDIPARHACFFHRLSDLGLSKEFVHDLEGSYQKIPAPSFTWLEKGLSKKFFSLKDIIEGSPTPLYLMWCLRKMFHDEHPSVADIYEEVVRPSLLEMPARDNLWREEMWKKVLESSLFTYLFNTPYWGSLDTQQQSASEMVQIILENLGWQVQADGELDVIDVVLDKRGMFIERFVNPFIADMNEHLYFYENRPVELFKDKLRLLKFACQHGVDVSSALPALLQSELDKTGFRSRIARV